MCTPTPPRPRTIKAGERQDILFGGGHRQNPLSRPDDRPTAAVAPPARHGGALAAGAMAGIAAALIAGPSIPYPLLHNGLLVPLFAALVFGLAQGGGVLGRALASRPLVALGDASYALYILQFPLM